MSAKLRSSFTDVLHIFWKKEIKVNKKIRPVGQNNHKVSTFFFQGFTLQRGSARNNIWKKMLDWTEHSNRSKNWTHKPGSRVVGLVGLFGMAYVCVETILYEIPLRGRGIFLSNFSPEHKGADVWCVRALSLALSVCVCVCACMDRIAGLDFSRSPLTTHVLAWRRCKMWAILNYSKLPLHPHPLTFTVWEKPWMIDLSKPQNLGM